MLAAVVIFLTAVVALTTALPFLKTGVWWIRVLDFPRTFIIALALVALVGWWFVDSFDPGVRIVGVVLLLAALVAHLVQILPYSPLAGKQSLAAERPHDDASLHLMVANVLTTNRQYDRAIELINEQNPDLLLLLEPDARWSEALTVLHDRYSYRVEVPLDNLYGMILFSRLELVDHEVRYVIDEDVPSIHARVRLPSGDVVDFHCLHPKPPRFAQHSSGRDAELVVIGREVEEKTSPVLIAGDLNDVAWSHTTRLFRRISGLLDPRLGRGLYSTFPAFVPIPWLRFPLDHIFHSEDFRLIQLRTLPPFGSDHLAVSVRLSYEPEKQEQDPPEADAGDEQEAGQILEEQEEGEPRLRGVDVG